MQNTTMGRFGPGGDSQYFAHVRIAGKWRGVGGEMAMQWQKRWWLGCLGLVGLYKLPVALAAMQGQASAWEFANLGWLIWLLYFVPVARPSGAGTDSADSEQRRQPPARQSPANDRQLLLDALRGFALFGILVVNITAFASPYYGLGIPDPGAQTPLGQGVAFLVSFLFETKFYLLFSFLFGYSFTIQMRSAERDGKAFAPRILRRLLGLWVIGLLHAVVLFHGDILTTYAVIGVVLLLLRNQDDKRLGMLAVGLIAVTAALWAAAALAPEVTMRGHEAGASASAQAALAAYRGTPMTVIVQHLHELTKIWVVIGLMQGPTALAMFLAGLIAGRHALFAHVQAHRALFRRLFVVGAIVGLPGAAAYAYTSVNLTGTVWEILGLALSLFTAPFLTAAYGGGMMLVFQSRRGQALAGLLAPAGRMALSNYLLQSLTCAVIFYAYGFRMIGEVPPIAGLGLAVAIFAGQLVLSRWWMARFAYGPLEWLLRAFTLLRFSPMR